jgi:hypothetical protein
MTAVVRPLGDLTRRLSSSVQSAVRDPTVNRSTKGARPTDDETALLQDLWTPAHRGDCGVDDCGCVHYEARPNREDRQRTWIVSVQFFEKNR